MDNGVEPKTFHCADLVKKSESGKSDKTVRDLICLLFDTSWLTSGFNFDVPTQFAGRIHLVIKFVFSIDDYDEGTLEFCAQQLKESDFKKFKSTTKKAWTLSTIM